MDANTIKIGVGVIVKQDEKILLGLRKNVTGSGSWGLPGGHLEYGESITDCGRRELLEETGIQAGKLTFLSVINDPREEDHYVHFVLQAESITGTVENLEPEKCEKWDWFSVENFPESIFFGHKKLLSAVLNHKLFSDV